ncbi:DUF2802 domain-containing protein [Catenovulum adriaticum]|uniref:DUF2802 domain-containing protein n=1 Tax=Catenovulum adriaticum TaxID=2984846 RepID=A0ABY7APA1_9ALTE|nr:DUF2802 domain-containing protein [Catenovulum sp. TS8]WAJ71102.1 DUF2802 domain-containing protein [Catenovulum sp. TS8]
MIDLSWISLGLAIFGCFFSVFILRKLLKKQASDYRALSDKHSHLERENKILRHEIDEIRSGSIGIGQSVKRIQAIVLDIESRQGELELQDPESKLYTRAAKMAEKGATAQEISTDCEIPMVEAELIVSLRQKSN